LRPRQKSACLRRSQTTSCVSDFFKKRGNPIKAAHVSSRTSSGFSLLPSFASQPKSRTANRKPPSASSGRHVGTLAAEQVNALKLDVCETGESSHMTTAIRREARSSEGVGNLSRNVKRVQSVTSLKAKAGQTPADNGARIENQSTFDKKDEAKAKVPAWRLTPLSQRIPSYGSRKEPDAIRQRRAVRVSYLHWYSLPCLYAA